MANEESTSRDTPVMTFIRPLPRGETMLTVARNVWYIASSAPSPSGTREIGPARDRRRDSTPRSWKGRHDAEGAHHGNHWSGRLAPRRAVALEGIPGLRHGSPGQHGKLLPARRYPR